MNDRTRYLSFMLFHALPRFCVYHSDDVGEFLSLVTWRYVGFWFGFVPDLIRLTHRSRPLLYLFVIIYFRLLSRQYAVGFTVCA